MKSAILAVSAIVLSLVWLSSGQAAIQAINKLAAFTESNFTTDTTPVNTETIANQRTARMKMNTDTFMTYVLTIKATITAVILTTTDILESIILSVVSFLSF